MEAVNKVDQQAKDVEAVKKVNHRAKDVEQAKDVEAVMTVVEKVGQQAEDVKGTARLRRASGEEGGSASQGRGRDKKHQHT
mmetsp:Transcript_26885/g.67583  ORF Transcript_26885/g.67583 Transcript_26885/m.67583 type:complete len:81 (+) Transcript_26885:446-688(+)